MAEKTENEVLNGAETSQEEKTPDETLTAPGEQPQAETPGQEADKTPENPAPGIADAPPEVADGDVVIPSNVIDGLFEDKRAAAKEAEKKAAEMETGEKDAPAKKGRGGRPPKADKPEKAPQAEKSDKSDKPKRGGRPPKATKNEKSASIGGGSIGGASGQTPAKEEAPPVPAAPEPPRDANRINETETIVYIDHSELHPFKNHPFQVRDDDAMKTLLPR